MLRVVHVLVVAALVLAAADVYKIKFESTLQAERVAKLRAEVRRERDAIATLRANWSELDNPERVQALARRHLPLKPVDISQYDALDRLPERPPQVVPPIETDPIASLIGRDVEATGSIPSQAHGR
jgi:cell division protein FtsL